MIPREIDDLMWTIAEGTDSSAIEAFGDRYPNLREELLKRIRTVNALKSGSRLPKSAPVPTFQNTQVRPPNWRLVWATFGFAILAMFAFGIIKYSGRTAPIPEVAPVNVNPAKVPDANIQVEPIRDLNPMIVPHNQGNDSQNQAINPPAIVNPPQNSETITSGLKTLKLESAPLHTAILLIAEAGHFSVTIANGTPNPTVKLDFEGMEPMDMLKELGQQYAFTSVIDGQRAILIIPKKDEDEGQITDNNR
jgi:hypothetical protein